MNRGTINLIAKQTFKTAFRSGATILLTFILGIALAIATYIGWENYKSANQQREDYQKVVRDKWEAQPDKHPHRMSHYGYLAFRPKHELSFFDFGIESFAGVSIFLEAHKQNTVNFSEASFSSGMLRFGEMSVAMVLQVLVPLLIFFLGYASIAAERESGTLRILLCQGVSWKEILAGKVAGIIGVTFILFIPVICVTLILWWILSNGQVAADTVYRLIMLITAYIFYFIVCAAISVLCSAFHKTAKGALTTLIVVWIIFVIVLPKVTQAVGMSLYTSPARVEFEDHLKQDIKDIGNSHNPDDSHFKELKAQILKDYNVKTISELPFNYNGYIMEMGERNSSGIFNKHYDQLIEKFSKQNSFTQYIGYFNPYLAIKNISMALTGADFANYIDFQRQAENYRYLVVQTMNQLHKQEIKYDKSISDDRKHKVDKQKWLSLPPFRYQFKKLGWVFGNIKGSLISIVCWLLIVLWILKRASSQVKPL